MQPHILVQKGWMPNGKEIVIIKSDDGTWVKISPFHRLWRHQNFEQISLEILDRAYPNHHRLEPKIF